MSQSHSILRPAFSLLLAAVTPFLVQSLPAAIPPARGPQAQPTSIEELSRQLVAQHPEALFYEQALAPSPLAPSPRAADADAVAAWSAEVGQPFPWAGRLALRKALANRDRALAELGLARFRSALAARVRTLALDTIVAAEQTRITREVANRLLAVRTVLLERIPAGVAPTLELRMVEAAEVSLRRQADDAALDEREARSELNRLRRAPAASPLALQMPPSWWSWPECPPLDRLRAAAETNHFEWRARLAELAAQGILPQGAPRSPNHASAPTNLPLLRTPGATGTSSAAAQALRRQQAATLVEVARREQEEVLARAARTYAARRTTLSRWGTNGLPQFQSTAELADRSYRNGAIPIALYVEAQRQWAETASAFLQTQRDLMQTAAHLEELTGLSLAVPSPTDPVEP